MRELNQAGLGLIKQFEGLRLTAYRCPAGVLTIAYGWTNPIDGKVLPGLARRREAERTLYRRA